MKKKSSLLKLFLSSLSLFALSYGINAQDAPKREFRGAWLQTAFQDRYVNQSAEENKKFLIESLDKLKNAGINAVLFQVRPSADAFYNSEIEPTSRFWTGVQGVKPNQQWDPMEFLIEECHKRCMEFHAWINPYRVTISKNEKLSANHIYNKNPDWFVRFNDRLYFDPGLPQSRTYIREVIKDIVTRYDIDAIHFDDYFYPYPVKGKIFNDNKSFAAYGAKMGFTKETKDDWRRHNINILIRNLSIDIKEIKPWVLFGVSPFGIYRNKKSDPNGSDTAGLQNYDDLYADVVLWSNEGWIDYVIPQIYWEIGLKGADYKELTDWWNENSANSHTFIGQSISRSLDDKKDLRSSNNHLSRKIAQSRESRNISGNCFWYGYQIAENESGIYTALADKYHITKALIPAFEKIDNVKPEKVKKLKARWTVNGYKLMWQYEDTEDPMQKPAYFCIYQFPDKVKVDINNPKYLVATVKDREFLLPYENGKTKYTYVVTAVDRLHNESDTVIKKKIKL